VEDAAIMNYQVCEILKYVEDNFDEIDVDIFKETLGLIDNITKSGRLLAKKYSITHQAINLRYHKVLRKVKEKFSNLE